MLNPTNLDVLKGNFNAIEFETLGGIVLLVASVMVLGAWDAAFGMYIIVNTDIIVCIVP